MTQLEKARFSAYFLMGLGVVISLGMQDRKYLGFFVFSVAAYQVSLVDAP